MDALNVDALCRPEAWPHAVSDIQLIETHTSRVFLTGDYAYKIKKPVNFGFLDFSTLDKRRHCCLEELRLNRRLAPELYLDVVPITGSPDKPEVGGEGEAFEYAVRMTQFDTRCGFDELARAGALGEAVLDAAAILLARFHDGADCAGPESSFGTPEAVAYPVQENFDQIAPHIGDQLPDRLDGFQRLEAWSQEACRRQAGDFATRLAAGQVRECHGDLHLRNIVWWQGQVMPFDCLEFNPSLRWIDVMSELGFLLMDLDDHDLLAEARRFLNLYLEYSGDYAGLSVLRFYQVYRAMVRVKVESLRLAQVGNSDASMLREMGRYLDLAEGYTRPLEPRLLIAHGLSGSGKTHVSQCLLEARPLIRLRSDVERKRLFGLAPLEPSGSARDAGIYSLEANTRTYDRLAALAGELLDAGWPVLVDAAFLKIEERDMFRAVADAREVPFAIMHCEADLDVQRSRIAARSGDASEASIEVMDLQLAREEPLTEKEKGATIVVDTTDALDLEALYTFLG